MDGEPGAFPSHLGAAGVEIAAVSGDNGTLKCLALTRANNQPAHQLGTVTVERREGLVARAQNCKWYSRVSLPSWN